MDLLNRRSHDGSRQFAALPATEPWWRLRTHLTALAGVTLAGFLTDRVTEGWLDFTYGGHAFTVNDQFGQYWFFVEDPSAPDSLLRQVALHCEQLLRERAG
jgi:hypothetical protein